MDIDITKFSLAELDELISRIYTEKEERKEKEYVKLKNEFKNILNKMEEKGLYVYVDCECCGEESLLKFNNVHFDY